MIFLFGVVAIVFFVFAWLNLNDADSALWVGGYGYAGLLAVLAGFGILTWWLPGIGLAAYLVWIALIARRGGVRWLDFGEEITREIWGLFIASGWMIALLAFRLARTA